MKLTPLTVVLVATTAGALGVVVGLFATGPGPLLGSELGQRVLHDAIAASAEIPEGVTVARRGQPLPPLRLSGLDGPDVVLPDDVAGRPLLLNVWASWCAPCIKEMPELDRYARSQGEDGVQVLGLALDDPQAVRAFLRRVGVDYPQTIDSPGPTDAGVRLGNPRGVLPYSILVDAQGRLLKQKIGPFEHGEIDHWAVP